MENMNMVRLFSLVSPHLKNRGVKVSALCHDGTRAARDARQFCMDTGWNIKDLPSLGNLEVWLPRLFYLLPRAWRRLRNIASDYDLDCIVVGNDTTLITGPILKSAEQKGIPLVLVQEGVLPFKRDIGIYSKKMRLHIWIREWLQGRFSHHGSYYGGYGVTAIASFGERLKDELIGKGQDSSRIAITGNPMYDYMKDRSAREPVTAALSKDEANILFIHQDLEGYPLLQNKQFCRMVIQRICVEAQMRLIFKLHPRSVFEPEFIKSLVPESGSLLETPPKQEPISNLLKNVQVVMTVHSTVAIEAIYFGIPVVFLDCAPALYYLISPEMGKESGRVEKEDEISSFVLNMALDDGMRREVWKKQAEVANYHMITPDGKSSERVADLIVSTMEENP